MEPPSDPYKKIGFIVLILLLFLIPSEIALTRPNALANLNTFFRNILQGPPKVTTLDKNISDIEAQKHPTIFYLDLLYDPISKDVSKLGSGEFHGDGQIFQNQPSSDPSAFNYKIELVSGKGDILLSGWRSPYKEVIANDQGKYKIRTSLQVEKGETIKIYADNQKVWEEKI